ncbi:ABC transporter ATP-binding protein/permease [Alphaproteobacteria bacterium]|nr:ABC transporter ATP-binding protein/permease [Alphaproteobacteria bacterium]MDA9133064.1 ABC transporter ATP-binding protein/permease [Alphaproteobacteria bacterium]
MAEKSVIGTVVKLWPYIWPHDRPSLKRLVFVAVLLLIAAKLVTATVPFFFKYVTDSLAGNELDLPFLPLFLLTPLMLILGFVAARILSIAFNQLRDALFARVSQHAVRQLALRAFSHMHQLSLRFHLQRRTGGLSRVIERGTKGIESVVRYTVLSTLPVIFEFALYAGIFFYNFGAAYVLVIAITVISYSVFTVKTSNWRTIIRREMNRSDTEANTRAVDSLLNYETVKYFTNEKTELVRFDHAIAQYEKAGIKTSTSLGWLNFGQAAIFSLGMMASMLLSANAVVRGEQTIGDFVLIHLFLIQLSQPLAFIGGVYREIRQSLTDIEVLFGLLETPAEIIDLPNAADLTVPSGVIRFDNVHFHYSDDRPILRGISFDVPAGKTVAIVGQSGAGKSTISRLLCRFYDVTAGSISIDGQDIRSVKATSLRAAIGVVPQDTVLFNDTIGYNIHYGNLDAGKDAVWNAAVGAKIDGFIQSLPSGLETEVGERGLKLSGGEKQRVAIARAILKAPPILILDEATSSLDTKTEQDINQALDLVLKDRTAVIIAHRLSTIVTADEIIVLDKGQIAERGTHQNLLAQKGLYQKMWNRQQAFQEVEQKLKSLT